MRRRLFLIYSILCCCYALGYQQGTSGFRRRRALGRKRSRRDARMSREDAAAAAASAGAIDELVQARSTARAQRLFAEADAYKAQLERLGVALQDRAGGKTEWSWVKDAAVGEGEVRASQPTTAGVLALAHAAARDSGRHNVTMDAASRALDKLVNGTEGSDLHGRKAADAAFLFALAGVRCGDLFDRLAHDTEMELLRFGLRKSCRFQDILTMCERLAIAGVSSDSSVFGTAWSIIEARGEAGKVDLGVQSASWGLSSPHATRPLVHLFRHGARNHRTSTSPRGDFKQTADLFEDPLRPLCVDIGCGFGTSLHALGTMAQANEAHALVNDANFLGIDLDERALSYAASMATRSGLGGRLSYVAEDCASCLETLRYYPGDINIIMSQFPTPFRAVDNRHLGNGRLPNLEDFIINPEVLLSIKKLRPAMLLFQTNAMDVSHHLAAFVEKYLCEYFEVPLSYEVNKVDDLTVIPRRQQRFEQRDARTVNRKFHVGEDWQPSEHWPLRAKNTVRRARSETEAAYEYGKKPVFRLLYQRTGTCEKATSNGGGMNGSRERERAAK